jgi:sortase A
VAAVPYLVHGAPLDERPEGTGKPAHERVPVPRTVTVMAGLVAPGPIERVLQWAGADARRYVDVVVHNTGERPLRRAAVHLWAGRESAALAVGEPQAVATIPLLEPGEEWSARLPVDLPGTPPVGRYAVVGSVVGATSGGEFGAHVSTMPVIPILLAVALAVALPLGLARRLRRWGDRRRGREPRPVGAPWLIGMAASVALVAVSLLVREQWIQRSDRLAAEAAQSDLLTEFSARREALATPEAEALGAERRLGDLVSVIRLPDRTSWAVVEGVGDDQLLRGPGHYPGTAWPGEVGNSVVAGHSGFAEAPFDRLATVRPGERITLESPDATHVYVVHRVREVEETAMSVLLPVRDEPGAEPTSAELTLITCSYDGGVISGRWIVEATMESVN